MRYGSRVKGVKHWRCPRCGWLNGGKICGSCEKRKPRAKARPKPPSFRPWACVILALDPANVTGWAIWDRGKYIASGEVSLFVADAVSETMDVVDAARRRALKAGVPWVCVAERSFGGNMGTDDTSALGWWRFALCNAQLLAARLVRVYPSTWRARVLPKGMASAKRDAVRPVEQEHAQAIIGRVPGGDEAAAVMIGKWATKSAEVCQALPANARNTV